MENKIKKLWPVVAIACFSFVSMLQADQMNTYSSGGGNTTQESNAQGMPSQAQPTSPCAPSCAAPPPKPCPQPKPACPKPCDVPPAGKIMDCDPRSPARVITPDAGPRVCMGADVFITADFILWTPRQEGLEYAMSGATVSNASITSSGKVVDTDFDLNPGFKVGLGLNLGHDGWDIFAEYTWLQSEPSDSVNSNQMVNLWDQTSPARLTGKWDFKLNVIDLEMGRNFFVSQYLTLRPYYGFKGTWQDQEYTVKGTINDGNDNLSQSTQMDQDFDYWGFGIRTGLDTAWHFNRSWSIFGNFAISALWSGFDIERKDTTYTALTDTNTTTVNTTNDFHTILPVLELAIGLRWETWFSNDDYHFSIDAGWEEQVWWGMNRLIVTDQPQRDNGDLTMQGLTLHFRFDF